MYSVDSIFHIEVSIQNSPTSIYRIPDELKMVTEEKCYYNHSSYLANAILKPSLTHMQLNFMYPLASLAYAGYW